MTVLVPKADGDPKKKEETNVESVITKNPENEVEIQILPVNDEEKVSSKESKENSSNIESHVKKSNKCKIIILLIIWFISLGINKTIFTMARWEIYATGRTELRAIQAFFITLCSWLYLAVTRKRNEKNKIEISWRYYWRFIVPIAISMLARTQINPWRVWTSSMGETFTFTIEIFVPFFILGASNIILEHKVPYTSILLVGALTIIPYGCAWHETPVKIEFREAVAYALLIALEMVFSKKVMQDKRMHPLELLLQLGSLLFSMMVPLTILDFFQYSNFNALLNFYSLKTAVVHIVHGLMCWMQTVAPFAIISMVTPFQFSLLSLVTHFWSEVLLIPLYYRFLDIPTRSDYFGGSM